MNPSDLLKYWSDILHVWMQSLMPAGWVIFGQVLSKFLMMVLILGIMDLLLRWLFDWLMVRIDANTDTNFFKAVYQKRVHRSIAHLIPIALSTEMVHWIFWRHPMSHGLLDRLFDIVLLFVVVTMANRVLRALEHYFQSSGDHYRYTAFRSIYQTLQIILYGVVAIVFMAKFAGIAYSKIITSLGAMTAVLLLVFRDTILGLITGIHVSTSRTIKVGDWVGIAKYNLEGTVMEINLLTTKIQNFDKSISTIPTYDLLSTEIRNHQVMIDGNIRRIKRSIYFNIKSFRFIDQEMYQNLRQINLLTDYLDQRMNHIHKEKTIQPNAEKVINGSQLTNIGVFRKYAQTYLEQNKYVDKDEIILVRQMEITPQGMPLEIYCFITESKMVNYERIQADIFDHILTAAAEFNLEIMQVATPK